MSKNLSANAVALGKLARKRGFRELARRVDVSEGGLRHLATGRRRPSGDVRDRLLVTLGLPLDGWGAPGMARAAPRMDRDARSGPEATPGAPNASGGLPEPPPATLLERYRRVAATLEARLEATRGDPDTPARDVAALGQALGRALTNIGKLTGEGEVSERQVLQSPAFQRALAIIREAAAPFPQASKAIASALAQYVGAPKDVTS